MTRELVSLLLLSDAPQVGISGSRYNRVCSCSFDLRQKRTAYRGQL